MTHFTSVTPQNVEQEKEIKTELINFDSFSSSFSVTQFDEPITLCNLQKNETDDSIESILPIVSSTLFDLITTIINTQTLPENDLNQKESQKNQKNYIPRKTISNMIGIKEKDDSVKQMLKTLVHQKNLDNKLIAIQSEKLKKNKPQCDSLKVTSNQTISDNSSDIEIIEVNTVENKDNKKIINKPKIEDEESDEYSEPPSPKVQFKVGQNKKRIQHAENSFVIMNKTNEENKSILSNDSENIESNQNETTTKSNSIQCKICLKKYVSEANLKRHMNQMHNEKKSNLPLKSVRATRDDFLSHLNATATATIAAAVITDEISPKENESSDDPKPKKQKVKSIYDQILIKETDTSTITKPKFDSFTLLTKLKRAPHKSVKKSHLAANEDKQEPEEEKVKVKVKAEKKVDNKKTIKKVVAKKGKKLIKKKK